MKRIFCTLLLFCITSMLTAQENKLFKEIREQKEAQNQVNFIMSFSFSDLKNANNIEALRKKCNTDLNSVYSCIKAYVENKKLKLSEDEINVLKSRVTSIAERFYASNRYTLLKPSGGMGPIYGVGIDTIAKKQVAVVMLGGGCTVTEEDKRWEKITTIFNTKMESLLRK